MLQEYLEAKKLTQEKFGEKVGVSQKRISEICSGSRPSLKTAVLIEKETGIPTSYWFDREKAKKR